ncbi:hypothetical protein ES705_40346 [subsurface metagenome]
MGRKYFLVVLFLILAMFLSGCGEVTDESKVRNVIDEYFLTVTGQDWEKAKSYCIYGSDIYYETCSFEDHIDSFYPFSVDIIFDVDIFNITITTGDYASAYIYGSLTITTTDDDLITSDFSEYFYLQKISNDWKLYKGELYNG